MRNRAKIFTVAGLLSVLICILFYRGINTTQKSNEQNQNVVVVPNGLKMSINNVEESKYLGKENSEKLVDVELSIINKGSQTITLGGIDFELEDEKGKVYLVDPAYDSFVSDIKSEESTDQNLYFKIPNGSKVEKIIYHLSADESAELTID